MWVGCYVLPQDIDVLKEMGITFILSLQSDRDLANHNISLKKLMKTYDLAGIEMFRTPIPDFDRHALGMRLPRAVEKLENALAPESARVYVHCTYGINRGPTIAAAYLVKAGGLSAKEAFSYVTARRKCSPYLDTLQEYEDHLRRIRCI